MVSAALALAAAVACGRAAPAVRTGLDATADSSCWLAVPPQTAADSLALIVDEGSAASRLGAAWFVAEAARPDSSRCAALLPDVVTAWQLDAGASRLVSPDGRVSIHLRSSSLDPIEALDAGAELVITSDTRALRYAGARGDVVVELPPRTLYGVTGAPVAPDAVEALREMLARDVAAAGVKPASSSDDAYSACGASDSMPQALGSAILYEATDPLARSLAERLVSLALGGDSTVRRLIGHDVARAAAIPPAPMRSVQPGSVSHEAPAVVAWPLGEASSCAEPGRAVPLLEAASWLIVRRGSAGVMIGANGAPRVVLRAGSRRAQ